MPISTPADRAQVAIRPVRTPEPETLPALVELLQDSVHGGASVGFLAPLSRASALEHWQRVFDQLAGNLRLWVAECDDRIVGSVQLELCTKQNGQHRAEVQKLLVHTAARGRGIGSSLLRAVETEARVLERSLLVLDTLRGSDAEQLYHRRGWQFVGYIPDYAGKPDGELEATAVFCKRL